MSIAASKHRYVRNPVRPGIYRRPFIGEQSDLELSTLNNGLVGYWNLNSLNGQDLVDGNHVTYTGGVSNAAGLLSDGIISGSGVQNGSRSTTSGLNFSGSSFTIRAWVKSPTSSTGIYVRKLTATTGYSLDFFPFNPRFVIGNGVGELPIVSLQSLSLTWNRVVGYYNNAGAVIGIKVNSSAVEELAAPAYSAPADGDIFYIMYDPSTATVKLDEIAIWNRILTSGEHIEDFNGGLGKTYPMYI